MIRKVNVKDIYVSHLKEKLVKNKEGWFKWMPVDKTPKATGDPVLDEVAACLARDFYCTPEAVAAYAGMTLPGLRAIFENAYGAHLDRFLVKYWTLVALELLRCTDLTMSEIAERCGCTRRQLLNRVKVATGLPPKEYRQQNRPEDYRLRYKL